MTAISGKPNTEKIKRRSLIFAFAVMLCIAAFRLVMLSRDRARYCDVLGFSASDALTLWGFESVTVLVMTG